MEEHIQDAGNWVGQASRLTRYKRSLVMDASTYENTYRCDAGPRPSSRRPAARQRGRGQPAALALRVKQVGRLHRQRALVVPARTNPAGEAHAHKREVCSSEGGRQGAQGRWLTPQHRQDTRPAPPPPARTGAEDAVALLGRVGAGGRHGGHALRSDVPERREGLAAQMREGWREEGGQHHSPGPAGQARPLPSLLPAPTCVEVPLDSGPPLWKAWSPRPTSMSVNSVLPARPLRQQAGGRPVWWARRLAGWQQQPCTPAVLVPRPRGPSPVQLQVQVQALAASDHAKHGLLGVRRKGRGRGGGWERGVGRTERGLHPPVVAAQC